MPGSESGDRTRVLPAAARRASILVTAGSTASLVRAEAAERECDTFSVPASRFCASGWPGALVMTTSSGARPRVSIVVATLDEATHIVACLESLLAQDYSPDRLEVVVVDGGSRDATKTLVAEIARRDARVRLLDNPRRIAAAAFNIGIGASSGEIVSLASAHAELAADYVSRLVHAFEFSGAALVGGQALARAGQDDIMARAIVRAMSSPYGVGNSRFRYSTHPCWTDTAFPGAYQRWLFDCIDAFDEALVRNQDDDLHLRARTAGYRMWYDPGLISYYTPRSRLRALSRQYLDYGRWRAATLRKHRRVASARQLAPGVFVGSLVAGALAAPSSRRVRQLLACELASYGCLVAVGIGREVCRGCPPGEAALVGVALPSLHLNYGVGFWLGLCRRCGRP